MRRGEICLADLERTRGSEANKRRPVVIVSNNGANAMAERLGRGMVTIVAVPSNITQVYPFQVRLTATATGLSRDSKAQAEQVRSVDVRRLGDQVGGLPSSLARELDDALRLHLGL